MPKPFRFTFVIIVLFFSIAGFAQPWTEAPYFIGSKTNPNYFDFVDAYNRMMDDFEEQDIPGWKHFRRWEWKWEDHVAPNGILPSPEQYYLARVDFLNQNARFQSHQGTWIPLGIETWVNGNSGYNPGNGRINVVVNDPIDTNIIYIGSASGGFWKSTDFGQTWATTYDNIAVLGVSAIALNPANHNEIFIGTGDRDGADTKGIGILFSHDAGATFQFTGYNWPASNARINDILINPLNPNTLIAASNSGVIQSYDKGATWIQRMIGAEIRNLEFRPNDTNVVYATGQAFYRSLDGGATFVKVTNGLPHDTSRVEVGVSPANPDMVYVIAANSLNRFGGFYCSVDTGASFRMMSNSPNILGYATDGNDTKGQGWYDLAVTVDPDEAAHVIMGGINVWHSLDTGHTWTIRSHWVYDNGYEYTHADIHHLGFAGNNLFCGSDGGVFYSPDKGDTWHDLSAGLGITQFYRLGLYAGSDTLMAAGAQDNGSNIYQNGVWTHVYGADGMEADINDDDPYILYITSQNGGLKISIDGGGSFDNIKPNNSTGNWVTPFILHPAKQSMLVSAYDRVYKSYNEGFDWTSISPMLAGGNTLKYLAVAPSDTQVVYCARGSIMYVTLDNGDNWAARVPNSSYSITGITVDNNNAQRIWITLSSSTSDKVMYSSDAGVSWTDITGNLTPTGFNCITRRDNSPDALYIGTMSGVYYIDSTLTSWVDFSDGLPNVEVAELEIHEMSSKLRAATYGRGIWESYLYGAYQGLEDHPMGFKVYPNPSSDDVRIEWSEQGAVQMDLFNSAGSHVRSLYKGTGETIRIQRDGLPSGVYYLRMKSVKGIHTERVVWL